MISIMDNAGEVSWNFYRTSGDQESPWIRNGRNGPAWPFLKSGHPNYDDQRDGIWGYPKLFIVILLRYVTHT